MFTVKLILESSDVDYIEDGIEALIDVISDDEAELLLEHVDRMTKQRCTQLFFDYQIQDVNLVKRLDDKLQLMLLTISLAYYAGINYQTVLGTIKPWDAIIFNSLKAENKVVPMMTSHEGGRFMGAFVKAPQVGYHRGIGSFDLTSLYPAIIRECNISPETIVNQLEYDGTLEDRIDKIVDYKISFEADELSNSANGMQYRKDVRGVIPIEIEKVFFQRKKAKNEAFVHQQNTIDAEAEMKLRGLITE